MPYGQNKILTSKDASRIVICISDGHLPAEIPYRRRVSNPSLSESRAGERSS